MANEEVLAFVENERKNRKDYSLAYEELYARQKEQEEREGIFEYRASLISKAEIYGGNPPRASVRD